MKINDLLEAGRFITNKYHRSTAKTHNSDMPDDFVSRKASFRKLGQNSNSNKLFLKVPYAEKDHAKQLGARWSNDNKKWYWPTDAGQLPKELLQYYI